MDQHEDGRSWMDRSGMEQDVDRREREGILDPDSSRQILIHISPTLLRNPGVDNLKKSLNDKQKANLIDCTILRHLFIQLLVVLAI